MDRATRDPAPPGPEDPTDQEAPVPNATRPGDVLGDRYRLVDLLAESGEGRFWRGYDTVLERDVAVHVIGADDARAPGLMSAARQSAAVADRRVLRVLDVDTTDDVCFVVNEWSWGVSLDQVVASGLTLGPRRAAFLVGEVARAVAAAHTAGVTHGRLNPENVLVDKVGHVRVIGFCVDAALHGVAPDGDQRAARGRDLADLAGLLYCALTGRWAGASGSAVPRAPAEHGSVLRPRQVRAGIPRPLDLLCDVVLHPGAPPPRDVVADFGSARAIHDYLLEFVGDTGSMAQALLASLPPLREEGPITLPPLPDPPPHEPRRAAQPDQPSDQRPPRESVAIEEVPTEAGMPIFDDVLDDVSWLERRSTPAPPPPPFEEPPERPLFAAEDTRTPRVPVDDPAPTPAEDYWPWESDHGRGPLSAVSSGIGRIRAATTGTLSAVPDGEPVPGRSWLRLAALLTLAVLVGVGVLYALNRNGDGGSDPAAPSGGESGTTSAARLTGLTATAFDPFDTGGDGENDSQAPLAVDGDPATAWSTSGYNDQLGPPPGLKTGVGLVVDLGAERTVASVALRFVGQPTTVSLYLLPRPPTSQESLEPVATGTADTTTLTLTPDDAAAGRYLVVWLTALPRDGDGRYRGQVAEVVVRGE